MDNVPLKYSRDIADVCMVLLIFAFADLLAQNSPRKREKLVRERG
jgi:hypothetical protein